MQPHSRASAIILAAGMSRRMGTPKQLLRLGDGTLLERVLKNVRRAQADEIILVLGYAAETIQQQIALDGVRVVINPTYQDGMGTSLKTGLSALDSACGAALIVLADQPFVQADTLDQLIEYHYRHRPQILIPMYKGFRGNPLLLDRSVFPELMDLTGDIGCRTIFGSHLEGIHKLAVEDPGILLDIDSSTDFEKLNQNDSASALSSLAELETRADSVDNQLPISKRELVIVGRDAVARALASFGRILQFTVTIVDPLLPISDVAEADRVLRILDFSRLPASGNRSVVIASRGQFDEEAVEQALCTGAAYIALLANKKRAQQILRSLELKSIPREKLAKLRAPAGIDIGAENPQEIALSIMAEIICHQHRTVE